MNSRYRERLQLTLEHKPVDRCPIDLGGTPQSTVDAPSLVSALAGFLGFRGDPPADYQKFDRRILEHFDIDFRRAGALIGYDTGRRRRISDTESIDEYGITHKFDGIYWNIVATPLANATIDDIAKYELPPASQIIGSLDLLAQEAKQLYEKTPYVIVGEHPVFGVLELACWLCGYDHIMTMLALEPEFIHLLFGKILDFQKEIIREYYSRLGRYIHITTSGDDFGTQTGPFMSPAMWREFVKPYMRQRIAYTAQFTDAVYMHHSCGSIFDIIPDLAEIGVRILNPIQPVAGMDPVRLKSAYGNRIVFHGGLDTQAVLPSGDPERIARAVRDLISAMAPSTSGGYIFACAHNLQGDVAAGAVAGIYATALACQAQGK